MRAVLAIARATVAEALRSRVAVGLVLVLAFAQGALALTQQGDGTETGRASAFLASSVDLTWALLAVVAVFLATTSLSRELDDGRAISIAVTPVPRVSVLVGKWLGLGLVLAPVLALGLAGAAVRVELIHRSAPVAERDRIERELLSGRAGAFPPKLDTDASSLTLDAPALAGPPAEGQRAIVRARARLEEIVRRGDLPIGMKPEDALAKILKQEVVRALSVGPGRTIAWTIGPIPPQPDDAPAPIALRYRYSVIGPLAPGKGPQGSFSIETLGKLLERPVASKADYFHELPVPPEASLLTRPRLAAPVDGKVTAIQGAPDGGKNVFIDGAPVGVPEGFRIFVREDQQVRQGEVLASSSKVWLKVAYTNRNLEAPVVVVFPPEGPSLLYKERTFAENVAAAYLVLLGRILFLVAVGLALSTFLDGKVAALATLFVLGVAAAHGFLDDAIGPILGRSQDNVFGPVDAPVKALLRGVLFALPDLGRDDPSDALATGQSVPGVAASLLGLALAAGGAVLAAGGFVFSRRELEGRKA